MDDELEHYCRQRLKLEEDRKNIQACSVCQRPMPENAAFCIYCSPPDSPKYASRTMSNFSAIVWILALCISFSGFLFYKHGGKWEELKAELPNLFGGEIFSSNFEEINDTENAPKVVILVDTKALNVRSKPSIKSDILGVLHEGEELTVLDKQGNWVKINFNGAQGWVASRLLKSEIR